MNSKVFLSALCVCVSATAIFAQVEPSPTPTRQRIIVVGQPDKSYYAPATATPTPTPTPLATPSASPTPGRVVVVTNTMSSPTPLITPRPVTTPIPGAIPTDTLVSPTFTPTPLPLVFIPPSSYKTMSLGDIRNNILNSKRIFQTRPVQTALSDNSLTTNIIRIGFYDWKTSNLDFVTLAKPLFLSKQMVDLPVISTNGKNVRIRTVRSNFVNTAVVIIDENNQPHTPLVVQYPIEKFGRFTEMAYYISAHPGLVTPEVVGAGNLYVRNTIDIARQKLAEKGQFISPQIADIAERLSMVEHVDHQRFWTEPHLNLYNEVFALYALNEGNTYRYSVSTAGAGGMVQMIPSTYAMVRNRYYSVGLMPDFVEGMRNHANAAQAMLLYMQMTWNDLSANETVLNALDSGIATQAELMAAGYNSNPARLPLYIRRGGAGWKNLIPRETKIYLQIYSSLESNVPMAARTK